MTTPASPVTLATDLSIPGSGIQFPSSYTIYTVQSNQPERIEAVYMVATFVANSATTDTFTIQLRDITGVVLYEQATPPLLGVNNADFMAFLTWSRLGNDTAQLAAAETLFSVDNVRRAWCNMRLPDLVLQNGSTVVLNAFFEDGAESSPTVVTDIAVTVARDVGAASDTFQAQGIPLLTDISTG